MSKEWILKPYSIPKMQWIYNGLRRNHLWWLLVEFWYHFSIELLACATFLTVSPLCKSKLPLCKKTPPEIVSEIPHQIVSEVCKNTPPKSKKRSIDKTEIDKKKGDKKRQKKNTIEPSGEQLLAEQTLAMKSPAMQALWEKPQNFNLVQDRSSKKQ